MIKLADQIVKEIEESRKKNPLPTLDTKGYVTGEEYEEWMRREHPKTERMEKHEH